MASSDVYESWYIWYSPHIVKKKKTVMYVYM